MKVINSRAATSTWPTMPVACWVVCMVCPARANATWGRSLVAQSLDGVEARRLPRRVVAEDDADGRGDQHGGDDGGQRRLGGPLKEHPDEEGSAAAEENADGPAEQAQDDGLDEEL